VRDFRKLKVWVEGHELTLRVYEVTGGFLREELYGVVSQLRRCSASIPANIAEGCGRSGDAELHRFMVIAMGSASELEYHLLLAYDLRYLTPDKYRDLSDATQKVKRMLSTFVTKLCSTPTH
jgi:four helix bundle protein